MKKIEYYIKNGNIDYCINLCQIAQICKYGKNCRGKHCEDCEFHGNENGILKELLEEYKEPIKLTLAEKCILEIIDKKFKWISRDSDNRLYIYGVKPSKYTREWGGDTNHRFDVFYDLFKFIKWEDEEPYLIEDILNNCEVV